MIGEDKGLMMFICFIVWVMLGIFVLLLKFLILILSVVLVLLVFGLWIRRIFNLLGSWMIWYWWLLRNGFLRFFVRSVVDEIELGILVGNCIVVIFGGLRMDLSVNFVFGVVLRSE